MTTTVRQREKAVLKALPDDRARRVLWRFAGRPELDDVVRASRAVARGPVARLVASGGRDSHDWTPEKDRLLACFDEAGLSTLPLAPEHGGSVDGSRRLATSLAAFELAWVDAGAATCIMAAHLALAPLAENGTDEQKAGLPNVGRGAFCLTEPLPNVGVDTGMLDGKMRISEWTDGGEPVLEIEKRGRFITNMAFADFVTAAVDSDDRRIGGSAFVLLRADDEGTFDRGKPTAKLVHQISSNSDPVFRLRVPASRLVGGYDVEDGVLIPRVTHADVLETIFRGPRVTVGLMTAAKLLSAVEPVVRYQRERFRGSAAREGSPRYKLGLQQREDALHRLVDVWATGEAAASLGFAAARLLDALDEEDVAANALADVLTPATKLWATGHGANLMREAVSLVGGAGITESCPGFLGQKWMDAQLEATYEGPEAVQRRQLAAAMTDEVFLTQFRQWIPEMREISDRRPGTGACTVASSMETWLWTMNHLDTAKDANGKPLYRAARQGVTFPMADALCWVLASRQQILDVLELEENGADAGIEDDSLDGWLTVLTDLCHVQSARAAGEVGRICADLIFGYNVHPSWEDDACLCYCADELDALEALIPGIGFGARAHGDVLEADGSHPPKAGPCVRFQGAETFNKLRRQLDGCLTGARLAKDRAARQLTLVAIPDELDYPQEET